MIRFFLLYVVQIESAEHLHLRAWSEEALQVLTCTQMSAPFSKGHSTLPKLSTQLKERCRKVEFEIISLLRRVQEAQEGASRVPELERELKIGKERIEKQELRGVQTTEMHQH